MENILLLRGNLGSGKTTFVRNLCEILDIENQVSSPSFLILNTYIDNNSKISPLDFTELKMNWN